MKIKHPSPATGYDYMIAVDRVEWVALVTAVEMIKEDLEDARRQGKLLTETQRGLLALYTAMHATMEANRRACPDLPIQDEAVRAPGGGNSTRFPAIQEWARGRVSLRPQNRKDQDDN
jgi:hypothetical protein